MLSWINESHNAMVVWQPGTNAEYADATD